jgi:hypothetical protein
MRKACEEPTTIEIDLSESEAEKSITAAPAGTKRAIPRQAIARTREGRTPTLDLIPPVTTGALRGSIETEVSNEDPDPIPRRLNSFVVEDTTLPPTLAHSAKFATSVSRRRAIFLAPIFLLICVASTTSGVNVPTNREVVPYSRPKTSFNEFIETLLPVKTRDPAVLDPLSVKVEWPKSNTDGIVMDGWRMLPLSVVYY